jgi:hypothetical protein
MSEACACLERKTKVRTGHRNSINDIREKEECTGFLGNHTPALGFHLVVLSAASAQQEEIL